MSSNAEFQYRRRICEYAAQWKASRTELSLYSCASGALRATRNALLTPGCPTSCPIAEMSSVKASNGLSNAAMGDTGLVTSGSKEFWG